MEAKVLYAGFPVEEEIPDEYVKGVYQKGETFALWYGNGDSIGGVVSTDRATYDRLKVLGAPEIPSLFHALQQIGFDPSSIGLDPAEDLEYVHVRRHGRVFSDEFLSWFQVDGAVCYLEEVETRLPDLPRRWLEVRLPWEVDAGRLCEAFLASGCGASFLGGCPAVLVSGDGLTALVGEFPDGGGYCLLPIPEETEDVVSWASEEGAAVFDRVFEILRPALGERIGHGRLADPGGAAAWQLAVTLWESRRPVAVELFAGAGGMVLGNLMAGFDVRVAVEIDNWACETLRQNFPGLVVLEKDIHQVTAGEIRQYAGEEIDLVSGGPPCQGYSMAGKRLIDDPRNTLYREFMRLVRELKPKVVEMENVPGLLTMKHATGNWAVKDIWEDFEAAGYRADLKLLNAANYGVPQRRKRILFKGIREDVEAEVPWPGPVTLPAEEILLAEEKGLPVAPGEPVGSEAEPGDLVFVTPGAGEGYFARCCEVKGESYRAKYAVVDLRGRRREVNCWNVLVYPGRRDAEEAARLLKRPAPARKKKAKSPPAQASLFDLEAEDALGKEEVFELLLSAAGPWVLLVRETDRWGWIRAAFEHPEPHATGARARVYARISTGRGEQADDPERVEVFLQPALAFGDESVTLNTYCFTPEGFKAFFKPGIVSRVFARDAVLNLLLPEHHPWSHIAAGVLAGQYAFRAAQECVFETLADLLVFRTLGVRRLKCGRVEKVRCTAPWVKRDEKGRRTFRSTDPLLLLDAELKAAARVLRPDHPRLLEIARRAAELAFCSLAGESRAEPWPGIGMPEKLLAFRPYKTVWDAIGDLPEAKPGGRGGKAAGESAQGESPGGRSFEQLRLFD